MEGPLKIAHAHLDEIQANMCAGKRRYSSRDQAKVAVEQQNNKHGFRKGRHFYYCVFCNYYHTADAWHGANSREKKKRWMTLENLLDYDFESSRERAEEIRSRSPRVYKGAQQEAVETWKG